MGERVRAIISNPYRLRRFGGAVTFAVAVAIAFLVVTADGAESRFGYQLGGDFPAFYVAGEMARDDLALLLDIEEQSERTAPYFEDAIAPFPYPPATAYVLVPFTLLPYAYAYGLAVLLLAIAAIAAALLLCSQYGVGTPVWRHVAVLGTLTFPPVFRSIGGAQNATVTLVILALGWYLYTRRREWATGLALGLLWFKPQFAVPVLLLMAVGRMHRAALVMTSVGAGFFLLHAAVLGWDWVGVWYSEVVSFTDAGNRVHQVAASVSPVEVIRGWVGGDGGDVLGYGAALVLGAFLAVWFARTADPGDRLVVVVLALLVTAPHALTYELALLVPVIGLRLSRAGQSGIPSTLAYHVSGMVAFLAVHPLIRTVYVGMGAWLWRREPTMATRGTEVVT